MNAPWRRRRDEGAAPLHEDSAEVPLGTVILALIAGALLTVTTGLAAMLELEQFGPAVGGIIVFKPDPTPTEQWSISARVIEAASVGLAGMAEGKHCVLRPRIMATRGGSLAVEARRMSRPPMYRVHWAGGHTDAGAADCGTVADLMLDRTELMRLANVAGGFNSGLRLLGP